MPNDSPTELADELYKLVTGDGATPAAIREMPALMSLTYIRAEAFDADGDVREDAVAATVRELIEQATYALEEPVSQRDDKDADTGAAARCLLGLHPGTGSMLRGERRKRAAGYLIKEVRTMTKRRERNGRVISHEMLLMEQLAGQLWDREIDFLRDSDRASETPSAGNVESPLLRIVSNASTTARLLQMNLHYCIGIMRPEPDEDHLAAVDQGSLKAFCLLCQLITLPSDDAPPVRQADDDRAKVDAARPQRVLSGLFKHAPLEREVIERLHSWPHLLVLDIAAPQWVREQLPQWQRWLASCQCDPHQPDDSCTAHQFHRLLGIYIHQLDNCWNELTTIPQDPLSYQRRRSPTEIVEYYAIQI